MLFKRCLLVGILMAAACWQPAVAASCLEQVEEVARATGLDKNIPGASLLSQFGGGGSSGQSSKQAEASNLLQSAKSDAAKGDEQGCLAQLAKARQLLGM